MKEKVAEFAFFAFPVYWTVALVCIMLFAWKTPLMTPGLLAVIFVSVAIIAAAIFLFKKCWWISLPMIALGAYIALLEDQFSEHIFRFFGVYMILHYVICGIYAYKHRNDREE